MLRDHLQGQLDLIAEVDDAQVALERAVPAGRLGELEPLLRRGEDPVGAVRLQRLQPLLDERDDLVGRAEMVGGLVVELQDLETNEG